jgi:putative ABC transport system permease protein
VRVGPRARPTTCSVRGRRATAPLPRSTPSDKHRIEQTLGRANALLRLSGALARSVRTQLMAEVVLLAAGSAVVSLPVGWLAIVALLDAQAVQSGIRPSVQIPMLLSAMSLPLVIACMLLALLIANPGRANTPLRDLLAS